MAYDDDPSLVGFAKYKMSGNKLKSEREAEAADKAKKAAPKKPDGMLETTIDTIKKRKQVMENLKCGGKVKKYARGGGIEVRGKTRGKFV